MSFYQQTLASFIINTYDLRIYYDSERPEELVSQSCPALCDPMECSLPGSPVHEFSRQEYWVDCHSILLGILWTQVSNPGVLHCRQTLYQLIHQGSPESTVQRLKVYVLFGTLGVRSVLIWFWSQTGLLGMIWRKLLKPLWFKICDRIITAKRYFFFFFLRFPFFNIL